MRALIAHAQVKLGKGSLLRWTPTLSVAVIVWAIGAACDPLSMAAQPDQAVPAEASPGSPAWIVDMFYARPNFPTEAEYSAGEFAQRWLGKPTVGALLESGARVASRLIQDDSTTAVFSTEVVEHAATHDWYTFLSCVAHKWRIVAVRSLLLPPGFYHLADSLSHAEALPDSVASDGERMRLLIESDSLLAAYLLRHEHVFDSLADLFVKHAAIGEIDDRGRIRHTTFSGSASDATPASARTRMTGLMHELHIGAVFVTAATPKCVFVKIGGVGDWQGGYIYEAPGCTVPRLSPDGYILVERVAPQWYLYKTD